MTRMQPIIDMIRSATLTQFDKADLGVQTSIIYGMVNSCSGTAKGFQTNLDDAKNITASSETRKSWEEEVRRANAAGMYLMAFLHRASHAVVAEDAEVMFDSTYDDGNERTGDDVVEEVAVKTHPYAWAKGKLIQRGIWPMTKTEGEEDKDKNDWSKYSDLTLWKYDAIVKKMAARAVGAWIIQIRDTGDIIPSKRSGGDAIIISMCPDIIKLGKIEDDELLAKRIVSFAKNNCAGVVYSMGETYSAHELYEAFEDITDQDEIDELKRDIRQTTREVRRSVHVKLVQGSAYKGLLASIEGLKKSGADEETLTDMIDGYAEQLNAKQYKELLACAQLSNAPDSGSST